MNMLFIDLFVILFKLSEISIRIFRADTDLNMESSASMIQYHKQKIKDFYVFYL